VHGRARIVHCDDEGVVTKRRRTPVGTEPPPAREAWWLDGSWLDGMCITPAPEAAPLLARGSSPPRAIAKRAITSEPTGEAAGTIDTDAKFDKHDVDVRVEAYKKALDAAPDQEHSVIVPVDQDWLARLELPPE
jgi:hypothetical protein